MTQGTARQEVEGLELRRRQNARDGEGESSRTTATPTAVTKSDGTTQTLLITPPSSKSEELSTLPSPLDTALASSFTDSQDACASFVTNMLADSDFKRCYPLSMLLQVNKIITSGGIRVANASTQGSKSFFEASKSLVTIVQTLDAACEADVDFCTDYLSDVAASLISDENCRSEYERRNSVIDQAYKGLSAYQPLYAATCLQDPDTSQYCYATAVTNLTTAANVYLYFLPLNMSYPGSAAPTCNWCLEETMAIFQSTSANRSKHIANTYESAAVQMNTVCGPEFVNDTLPEPREVDAAGHFVPPGLMVLGTVALAACLNLL